MKILDATTIIAIFNEISFPDLIEKILQLGHKLVIPSYIMESELLDKATLKITQNFVEKEKIQILEKNSLEEIKEFQNDFPGLGLGECDSMLSYQKLTDNEEKAYCILDDRKARTKASELGIEYTGLIGLLKMIKKRKIMSSEEICEIVTMLRKSDFRFPADVVILTQSHYKVH